jgi:hypothetical protein
MYRSSQSDAGNLFGRGWARTLELGFVEIDITA